MKTCSHEAFVVLTREATVIEQDRHGPKVMVLADGSYLKLFRRKRLLSSASWYPYAQRFVDNVHALRARGIPCPEVIDCFRVPAAGRDVVHYRPLPGTTLRQLITGNQADPGLRQTLGRFIATLHERGIYFRSIHLGNVVLTAERRLGLIDVADMKTGRRPLSSWRRRRNAKHLLRIKVDRAWILGGDGGAALSAGYREVAQRPFPLGSA
ncbi:toluene tolerance protein [Thauera aromatica]|nr:toluene tolerance protein [Thauera aromatica]